MTATLLKTGDAATRLGVSRQHVVNMCDRGDISYTHVGSHRRIPSDEIDRILHGTPMTRERERSLWLHRAVLGELVRDPERVVGAARSNVERWSDKHAADGMTASYLRKWSEVLDSGLDRIIDTLTSPNESASELRQNTPFAGVLDDATRVTVLRNFTTHWNREHESV
jgi:excisionase family DNA binding protein